MPAQKYREIVESLREKIRSGKYRPGDRIPSEAELVRRHATSRMTVFRAMRELQALGLITRRVGSGTFVSKSAVVSSHIFGLLIPELGQTEIFEVICKGMMDAPLARHHSLLWGSSSSADDRIEEMAEHLCHHFIAQRVSGVFFAPVEFARSRDQANRKIVHALDKARIPVVLLDRCIESYPGRSKYDLVGIDNRRASYQATEHLMNAGAKRVGFFSRPHSAPTVDARQAGFREALQSKHSDGTSGFMYSGDASDIVYIKTIMNRDHPDTFLCANDHTAGQLMHSLITLGYSIPQDIRIAGIDDVKYARLLPIPLTTQHQPCREIGRVALSVMMERLMNGDMPPRDILLGCNLIVRKSCGIATAAGSSRS